MPKTPLSRNADNFVVRMPDGMRERLKKRAENNFFSMNTSVVLGLDSFLNKHEDLDTLLEGVRVLKATLEVERADIADLKVQLQARLAELNGPASEPQNPE